MRSVDITVFCYCAVLVLYLSICAPPALLPVPQLFVDHPVTADYFREGGYVFISVCLFVSRTMQTLLNRFHEIRHKGHTCATEETVLRMGGSVLAGVCLIATGIGSGGRYAGDLTPNYLCRGY